MDRRILQFRRESAEIAVLARPTDASGRAPARAGFYDICGVRLVITGASDSLAPSAGVVNARLTNDNRLRVG